MRRARQSKYAKLHDRRRHGVENQHGVELSGFPGSRLRARLRPDAPDLEGLAPGRWYDVFGGEAARLGPGGRVLLRPDEALREDPASHVPVPRGLLELGGSDGSRHLLDCDGRRWLAALVPDAPDPEASRHLRLVCQDGRYLLVPGFTVETLDPLGDGELLELLESQVREAHPPGGLRSEARVKPAFAWGYRMLEPDAWYLVDPRWSTDLALVLVTVDGDRVVDAGHFDVQTFLD